MIEEIAQKSLFRDDKKEFLIKNNNIAFGVTKKGLFKGVVGTFKYPLVFIDIYGYQTT